MVSREWEGRGGGGGAFIEILQSTVNALGILE